MVVDEILNMIRDGFSGTKFSKHPYSLIFIFFVLLTIFIFNTIIVHVLMPREEFIERISFMRKQQRMKKKALLTVDKKLWLTIKRNEVKFNDVQRKHVITIIRYYLVMSIYTIAIYTLLRWLLDPSFTLLTTDGEMGLLVLPFPLPEFIPYISDWYAPYYFDVSFSVLGFNFTLGLFMAGMGVLFKDILGINLYIGKNPIPLIVESETKDNVKEKITDLIKTRH